MQSAIVKPNNFIAVHNLPFLLTCLSKSVCRSNGDSTIFPTGAFGSPQKVNLNASKDNNHVDSKPDLKEENGRPVRNLSTSSGIETIKRPLWSLPILRM